MAHVTVHYGNHRWQGFHVEDKDKTSHEPPSTPLELLVPSTPPEAFQKPTVMKIEDEDRGCRSNEKRKMRLIQTWRLIFSGRWRWPSKMKIVDSDRVWRWRWRVDMKIEDQDWGWRCSWRSKMKSSMKIKDKDEMLCEDIYRDIDMDLHVKGRKQT